MNQAIALRAIALILPIIVQVYFLKNRITFSISIFLMLHLLLGKVLLMFLVSYLSLVLGGDELRGSTRTGSPHTGSRVQSNTLIRASSSSSSTTSCPQKTKHSSTVNSLRSFQKNFDNAYQPNQAPQSHSSVEDAQVRFFFFFQVFN